MDKNLASILAVGAMFTMGAHNQANHVEYERWRGAKFRDMKTPPPSNKRSKVKAARKQNKNRRKK